MLIKVKGSVRDIKFNVINNHHFGTPIYQARISDNAELLLYETYTFRNGNYMSITICIESKEDHTLIHFVPLGTGRGILNFDWGKKSGTENKLLRLLQDAGLPYQIIIQ